MPVVNTRYFRGLFHDINKSINVPLLNSEAFTCLKKRETTKRHHADQLALHARFVWDCAHRCIACWRDVSFLILPTGITLKKIKRVVISCESVFLQQSVIQRRNPVDLLLREPCQWHPTIHSESGCSSYTSINTLTRANSRLFIWLAYREQLIAVIPSQVLCNICKYQLLKCGFKVFE